VESKVSRAHRSIRRTTTASVVLLAGIAAVVSYRHMHALALAHGEAPWTAALLPCSVDGMIVASSMSLLLDSRRGTRSGLLPWALLMIGSVASLAANMAVAEPTVYGRVIAAWPSLALVGAYELLMRQIRLSSDSRRGAGSCVAQESPPREMTPAARQAGGSRPARPAEHGSFERGQASRAASRERKMDLVGEALRLDAEHWARHRRPVSAEVLRKQLRVGAARARALKDQVRSTRAQTATTAALSAPAE